MISTTISSLMLLSAGVFSTPVYISDVKASREAGHLRVEVSGDGGIDPEGASTLIDDGRLVIYLGGTRVRADNRSWSLTDGAGEIRAHRHKSQTELVVPLAGNGCAGPVELTGTDTGITALVGCDGSVAAPRILAANVVEKSSKKTIVNIDKLKQIIELPAGPALAAAPVAAHAVEAMVAAEAMPAEAELPRGKAPPVTTTQPTSVTPVPRAVPPSAAPLFRVAAAEPVKAPAVTSVPAQLPAQLPAVVGANGPQQASTEGSGVGGLRAVALPALLLAALAAAAYWFSRRRRGTIQRHIQILETTNLGPKRSLICARIGDEMVILSSSEAGITLLKGGAVTQLTQLAGAVSSAVLATPSGRAPAPQATATDDVADDSIEIEQPLEEALADIPDPVTGLVGVPARASFRAIEGGLAGLFGKREAGSGRDDSENRFEDLLEDSLEDQELRQKLAAGMSARVR